MILCKLSTILNTLQNLYLHWQPKQKQLQSSEQQNQTKLFCKVKEAIVNVSKARLEQKRNKLHKLSI